MVVIISKQCAFKLIFPNTREFENSGHKARVVRGQKEFCQKFRSCQKEIIKRRNLLFSSFEIFPRKSTWFNPLLLILNIFTPQPTKTFNFPHCPLPPSKDFSAMFLLVFAIFLHTRILKQYQNRYFLKSIISHQCNSAAIQILMRSCS